MKQPVDEKEVEALRDEMARRFLQLRTMQGLSQAELAGEFNTSQNLIFRLENDLKVSTESLITVMLWYYKNFNISLDWLFSPDNTNLPMNRDEKNLRMLRQSVADKKRQTIIEEMMEKLKNDNLLY